jgi:hypothetical protein
MAGVITRHHRDSITTEWPERVPAHQLWLR